VSLFAVAMAVIGASIAIWWWFLELTTERGVMD
jgi:hypothetical protein